MSKERQSLIRLIVTLSLAVILLLLVIAPMAYAQGGVAKSIFDAIVTKKLTVTTGGADFQSAVTMDALTLSGDIAADDLSAIGNADLGNAAGDVATVTGTMVINGYRDATTGYDNYLTIQGYMDGITAGAKTRGVYINLSRPATANTTGGDLDDAGLMIRVTNLMTNPTAGNTLRGFDVQAKNDNPSGSITNLSGGLVSIQTDTGSPAAGNVSVGKALEVNTTINAPVTDTLMVADYRLFRQVAQEPTQEIGIRIRNSSTTGTGGDAALWIDSDGSGETDDWDYGVDMVGADMNTAEIRLSNGETIDNRTDGRIDISGALQYGTGNLYPLGYAASGYEIECGTTAVFTGSTTITATALTTVTVPMVVQVTAPITTAAYLHVSVPTTTTVTITSLSNAFDAGTTGIQAHYCLVGQE